MLPFSLIETFPERGGVANSAGKILRLYEGTCIEIFMIGPVMFITEMLVWFTKCKEFRKEGLKRKPMMITRIIESADSAGQIAS